VTGSTWMTTTYPVVGSTISGWYSTAATVMQSLTVEDYIKSFFFNIKQIKERYEKCVIKIESYQKYYDFGEMVEHCTIKVTIKGELEKEGNKSFSHYYNYHYTEFYYYFLFEDLITFNNIPLLLLTTFFNINQN